MFLSQELILLALFCNTGNLILGTKETLPLPRRAECTLVHESVYKQVNIQAAASLPDLL